MYKGKQAVSISASIDKVYDVALSYPTFVSFFDKRSRIIEKTDAKTKVEVRSKLFGFYPTKWEGEGVLTRPTKIAFTQTVGMFQGLTADWVFRKVSENETEVSIETIFQKDKLGKAIEHFLGEHLVEKTTKKILLEMKRCAEQ